MNIRSSLLLALLCTHASLSAATLTWDGIPEELRDGAGTWDLTSVNRWYNAAGEPPGYQAWDNTAADIALFGLVNGAAGTVTLGTEITAGGLIFNAPGSGSYTLTGSILTLVDEATVQANVAATISSSLAGTGGMLKTGEGILTLSGGAATANTLTGRVVISGGTLTTAKTVGVTAIAGDVEVATGGTFIWGANDQIADTGSVIVSGGTINFSNRNETILNYTQTAGGMTGSNLGVVVVKGTLAISGGTALTLNSRGNWTANEVDFTGYTSSGNVLLLAADNATEVTRFTIGEGGLTLSGQILRLVRPTSAGVKGNELLLQGDVTATGTNNIGPTSTAVMAAGAVNQLSLGEGTREFNITGETTVSLAIAGVGGLTKSGPGTLLLTGGDANGHAGLTTLSEGTLSLGKTAGVNAVGGNLLVSGGSLVWAMANQVPDTATITVSGGTTLLLGGRDETFGSYVQTGGVGFSATSGNSGEIIITGTARISAGGTITLNSGARMSVNLLDATGYSGNVLNLGGNNAARVTTFTVGSGGITMTGQSFLINRAPTAGNLGSELVLQGDVRATGTNSFNMGSGNSGVAQIQIGNGERTFAISAGITTSNIPLVGTGGVVKTGAGTLRLTVPSAYTGKTTVGEGTLALLTTGSIAASNWLQVDAGAVLDVSALSGGFTYAPTTGTRILSGSGQVTGNLIVGGVAVLRPGGTSAPAAIGTAGDGVGQLTISGALTFNPEVQRTVAELQIFSAGTADKIVIGGDLTLTANSLLAVSLAGDYVPASGDRWDLLDWAGLLNADGFSLGENSRTGSNLSGNEGNLDLPDLTPWGLLWEVGGFANAGMLTVSIVPEPSRTLLLGVGCLWLGLGRRRRKARLASECGNAS